MNVTNEDLDQLWRVLRPMGWAAVALVMLTPAVAMRFTDEVDWTTGDFVFAGVLLVGGAGLIELVAWRVRNPVIRLAFALFVVGVVAMIWAQAAVGII